LYATHFRSESGMETTALTSETDVFVA